MEIPKVDNKRMEILFIWVQKILEINFFIIKNLTLIRPYIDFT